jgi:hypothetical protein
LDHGGRHVHCRAGGRQHCIRHRQPTSLARRDRRRAKGTDSLHEEGSCHAPSHIPGRKPLTTLRFNRWPPISRPRRRNSFLHLTGGLRLRSRRPVAPLAGTRGGRNCGRKNPQSVRMRAVMRANPRATCLGSTGIPISCRCWCAYRRGLPSWRRKGPESAPRV